MDFPMHLAETTMMALHREAWQCSWQNHVAGMTNGSLIDCESQKIRKNVLSTTVAELYPFTKCFGSCQFLRGCGWIHPVKLQTNIHRRTDAKNLYSMNDSST